jgi:DNA-directed RNA polymerase subunit N (RpoN/RPB10)
MESALTFARIINPVCSCGNYVGRYQPDIELQLVELQIKDSRATNDIDVSKIITDMGITRMCCRNTIMISPILRMMTVEPSFNIYGNNSTISQTLDRVIIGREIPNI